MTEPKSAGLVDSDEKVRLIENRLTALATERYQLHVAELAGDDVSADKVKTLDESIARLERERDAAKAK